MVYTDRGARHIGERLEIIEWIKVDPGSTYVGSDNRAVMFGSPGPRHEVAIQYSFEISKEMIPLKDVDEILEDEDIHISSESEWQLAYDRGLISAEKGTEVLQDRIHSSYWGKVCDGRPFSPSISNFAICREWKETKASPRFLPLKSEIINMTRIVRKSSRDKNPISPRLPLIAPRARILREEFSIMILIGIIPSFVWAHFNASPGYIETGWPGLVLGGIILGLTSGIIWRPRQPTWWADGSRMYPRR